MPPNMRGWFYEGAGIYRHIWLEKYHNLHFANWGGVFVQADVTGEEAIITVETEVVNETQSPANAEVYAVVMDRNGKELERSEIQSIVLGS